MPTDTLLFPVPPRQPRHRRAHRNQPTTVVLPAVPAALQQPALADIRYHARLGHHTTNALLATRRQP